MIQNPGLCAWTSRTCLSKYMRLGTINEHSGQTLIFPGSMSYLLRTVYDNCHLPSIFLNSMVLRMRKTSTSFSTCLNSCTQSLYFSMASCVVLEDLSADELSLFLSSKGIPQKVLDNFQSHSIDGETFLSMSDGHLKEVAEKIPDRVKLKKIIDSTISAKKVSDIFCHYVI